MLVCNIPRTLREHSQIHQVQIVYSYQIQTFRELYRSLREKVPLMLWQPLNNLKNLRKCAVTCNGLENVVFFKFSEHSGTALTLLTKIKQSQKVMKLVHQASQTKTNKQIKREQKANSREMFCVC